MIASDLTTNNDKHFASESAASSTPDPLFTIGKMAEQYKVTLRALRFYESSGLLQPQRRGTTRLYSQQDRQRLEMILRGRQLGFSLAEIQDFIQVSNTSETVKSLESILNTHNIMAQIRNLERQREDLDRAIRDLHDMYRRMSEPDQAEQTDQGHSS